MERLAIAVAVVLLAGCQSWPAKNFERVTGIELQKENSLCLTITTTGAKGDCHPNVGGMGWQKVRSVQPLVLSPGSTDLASAQLIGSKYLGHRYARGSVLVNCPTINPFVGADAAKYEPYFQLERTRMSLASVLARSVVQEAKLELKAEAKAKHHPAISAEGMAAFESALAKQISETSTQSTDVIYVQGYMPSGLQEVQELAPYAACLGGMDPKNESIVTGIAGFYLADFAASSKVVNETMMAAAIDAAAAAAPDADKAILQDVKVDASGSWSFKVNKRIEQQMVGKTFGNTFYPLYIRFERKD